MPPSHAPGISCVLLLALLALSGCENPKIIDSGLNPEIHPEMEALEQAPPPFFVVDLNGSDLPPDLNRVRAAAMHISILPRIHDEETRMEIALLKTLYKATFETNVGGTTRCFLLEPPSGVLPKALAIDSRELKLRVLGGLTSLKVPMAWTSFVDGNPVTREVYPQTRTLATRLRVHIIERSRDGRSVTGEIGDWTWGAGSSRQGFKATWDGQGWNLKRDRVRLIW